MSEALSYADDEQFAGVFDALTAQGYTNEEISATIEYLTTEKSMVEVEGETDVSRQKQTEIKPVIIALTDIEPKIGLNSRLHRSAKEVADRVAALADLKRGEDYKTYENRSNTVYLTKSGWCKLESRLEECQGGGRDE